MVSRAIRFVIFQNSDARQPNRANAGNRAQLRGQLTIENLAAVRVVADRAKDPYRTPPDCPVVNPGPISRRFRRLRMNNPAPISSSNDSITCAATRALRTRTCIPRPRCRPPCPSKWAPHPAWWTASAGTRPKISPVSSGHRRGEQQNPQIRRSGQLQRDGVREAGRPAARRSVQMASTRPKTPPASRQQQALHQQLANDAEAPSADGQPDGDLLLP